MSSLRTYGKGLYHANENWIVHTPAHQSGNASLAIVAHGAGAHGWYYTSSPLSRMHRWLASCGMVVMTADLGSTSVPIDGWGNDTAQARITEAITWASTTWDCDTTTVHLIGDSAGGATVLNWAWRNTSSTASVVLRVGVANVQSVFESGNAFLAGLINDAYASAWTTQKPTHDPIDNAASLAPIADRIIFYYAPDDGLIPAAGTLATASAVGCHTFNLGNVGHDFSTTFPEAHMASFMFSRD